MRPIHQGNIRKSEREKIFKEIKRGTKMGWGKIFKRREAY